MVRSVLVGLTGPGRASAREVIALVHAVEARVAAPVSKSQLAAFDAVTAAIAGSLE